MRPSCCKVRVWSPGPRGDSARALERSSVQVSKVMTSLHVADHRPLTPLFQHPKPTGCGRWERTLSKTLPATPCPTGRDPLRSGLWRWATTVSLPPFPAFGWPAGLSTLATAFNTSARI